MYQLVGHDGIRFLKIVLLFKDLKGLVGKIHEVNKYMLAAGVYISQGDGGNTFLVDYEDQLIELHNDRTQPKLTMSTLEIKGLPVKYTSAPKFVFLNDRTGG